MRDHLDFRLTKKEKVRTISNVCHSDRCNSSQFACQVNVIHFPINSSYSFAALCMIARFLYFTVSDLFPQICIHVLQINIQWERNSSEQMKKTTNIELVWLCGLLLVGISLDCKKELSITFVISNCMSPQRNCDVLAATISNTDWEKRSKINKTAK